MKAYRLVNPRTAAYEEVPTPDPGPGQILVKVGAAGLCHSDVGLLQLDEGFLPWKAPFTLGHESAGWVEAVGPGVTSLEAGDAVAVYTVTGCGSCARCHRNEENLCERSGELPGAGWGLGFDGGLAPYMLVDSARQLVPLGDLDPVIAAPLTDAGITPYRAIRRSRDQLGPGARAVVIGVGGLGHLAVQILAAVSPAEVIAVDTRLEALALATAHGAAHAVTAGEAAAGEILELTHGLGVDFVLDIVGSDESLQLAMAIARAGAKVVVAGLAGGSLPWSFFAARSEVELTTSLGGNLADLHQVIALAADGHLTPEVTTFGFDEIPHAFEILESGALNGRAVVLPHS